MSKLKTHSGLKKKLNVRQSGSVSTGHQGSRHNTGKKSGKFNRKVRKQMELHPSNKKKFKEFLNIVK